MKVLNKPSRRPHMPETLAPMLAVLSARLPADQSRYAFEYKWDGVRALWRWDGRDLSIWSRNQLEITKRYPELWPLPETFGSRPVILDGEIIALDHDQRPSFTRLQHRMHVNDEASIRRLRKEIPVWFVVFDVLYLDGRSLIDRPWVERRDRLEELELDGPAWMRSPAHVGEGTDVLAAAREMKLEGVVAKKLDSVYRPGARSPDWLKVKIVSAEEFVVGGWVPETGTRTNRIGSLLLGYYDAGGRLHFAGGVGTGFNDQSHRQMVKLMQTLSAADSPFAERIPKREARFVRPEAVVQVEYRRKTPEGVIHQASFKGLRTDKKATDVRGEG